MAEDFYKLFKLGADDKHVSATVMASISLVASKELQSETNLLKEETALLKIENTLLKERLASLEKLVTGLASGNAILPTIGDKVAVSE